MAKNKRFFIILHFIYLGFEPTFGIWFCNFLQFNINITEKISVIKYYLSNLTPKNRQ